MKLVSTIKALFPAFLFLLGSIPAMGQEKFNISAGIGAPELLNLGVRYQMGQSQLGLSAGILPWSYDNEFSVGVDYFYHFWGATTLATRRPWYGRIGLYHHAFEDEFQDTNLLLLVPRLGKDFNLSPKVGIAADAGVSLVASRNSGRYEESFWWFDDQWEKNIALSIGVSIFYRL